MISAFERDETESIATSSASVSSTVMIRLSSLFVIAPVKRPVNEPSKMAAEFSPGRKPGDQFDFDSIEPAKRGAEFRKPVMLELASVAPSGLTDKNKARYPGLTPGTTLCRPLMRAR